MADYQRLLSLCTEIMTSFDSEKDEEVHHLESSFENMNVKDEDQRSFISGVFNGCQRYKVLIKVVVDGFYILDGRTNLRIDYHLYSVISYLIIFHLEELGMKQFKKIIASQNTGKMYKFLRFFFNKENLNGWMSDEWCRLYDYDFIKLNVLTPLLRVSNEMEEVIGQLSSRLANKSPTRTSTKQVTEARPFKLTKPKPRSIPASLEEVPMLKPSKQIPKTTYKNPVEQEKLSKSFQSNRMTAEINLLEADRTRFSCANPEKSEKTQMIMKQIIKEKEYKNKIIPVKPTPVPATTLKETLPVKMNTATIFREGARIQKEEEELEKKLTSLEAGEGDDTAFLLWQKNMKQRDAAEEKAEIEKKHLEGQISYEGAILAKRHFIDDTKEQVQKFREEVQEMRKQHFAKRKEERLEMRKLVEATMAGYQNACDARAKLTTMKQKLVQEYSKERQQLIAKALEEEELEMRQKTELVSQIRAMESVPIIRANSMDLTETSGKGLLSEMSVAELRERLSLMKIAADEERKEKRKAIKNAKQEKEQYLNDAMESISQYKEEQAKLAANRQQEEQNMFEMHHAKLKAEKLDDLQERLANKRRERERLQKLSLQVLPASSSIKKYNITQSRVHANPEVHFSDSSIKSLKAGTQLTGYASRNPSSSVMTTLMRMASRT